MSALAFLSSLVCGSLIVSPRVIPNLAWCKGEGLAAVWQQEEGRAVALVECVNENTFPRYYVGDEYRQFRSFETQNEWVEFAKT